MHFSKIILLLRKKKKFNKLCDRNNLSLLKLNYLNEIQSIFQIF